MELTREEYSQLEPFLLALGVRTRMTSLYNGIMTIQAENAYRSSLIWANQEARERIRKEAEELLELKELNRYKL